MHHLARTRDGTERCDPLSEVDTCLTMAIWIEDSNTERAHQSLKYRTPHEVRREALESTQSAA